MPKYTFNDWIVAAEAGGETAQLEEAIIENYAEAICSQGYTLAQLIVDLGPYVDPEANLISVARALALLAPVFNRIKKISPSRHDIHLLVGYFCARLRNEDNIPNYRSGIRETASCLQALANWPRFIPGDAAPIVEAIFVLDNGTQFSSLAPSSRVAIFELVGLLFRQHLAALKRDLGGYERLITGLVSLVELEKNPSCLGVIFPLYSHIGQQWSLSSSELVKIWDSFIRYFPITLGGGGPRDPSVPSKEQLRDNLLQCVTSNDGYASHSIPYFIDRLDVDSDISANIKMEVFNTIVACVKAYSLETVSKWSTKLWDSLKFEIWNGENDDFINASLRVIKAIGASLSAGPYDLTDHKDALGVYVLTAATECSSRLHDSKKKYALPSGKILNYISTSSPYAFFLVVKTVLPTLLVIWQDLKLDSEKKMILSVINGIIAARVEQEKQDGRTTEENSEGSKEDLAFLKQTNPKMENAFQEFRNTLVELYSSVVLDMKQSTPPKDISYGIPAIQGLSLLFQIPHYLSEVDMAMVAQLLNSMASRTEPDIHTEILTALQQISAYEPQIFREITLPNFMENLFENSPHEQAQDHEIEMSLLLLQDLVYIGGTIPCRQSGQSSDGVLSKNAGSYWHRNFNTLMEKLLEKFKQALQPPGHLNLARVIIGVICVSLESFDEAVDKARESLPSPDLEPKPSDPKIGPYTYIVFALFRELNLPCTYSCASGHPEEKGWYSAITTSSLLKDSFDDISVQLAGRIAMMALRSKLTTAENNFLTCWDVSLDKDAPSGIWTLFTEDKNTKILCTKQMELERGPPEKCLANVLSTYLIAGLRPEAKNVISPRFPIGVVAATMIRNAVSPLDNRTKLAHMSMLWMLQLLVNKFSASSYKLSSSDNLPGGTLLEVMQYYLQVCLRKSRQEVWTVYQTLAYFAAASLASFDKTMEPLINMMIEGITSPEHGRKVAQSFRILLAPSEIMNKENFCKIRVLRNARLLAMTSGFYHSWRSAQDKELKDNYLVAYAGVLKYIPSSLLVEDSRPVIEGFLPMVLEGTNVKDDNWTKEVYISLLLTLLPLTPSTIVEHLDSVIGRMTDRTHNTYDSPSDANVTCRALALEVLGALPEYVEHEVLVKRRSQLMNELDLATDDCSRVVRRKAEQAKGKWTYSMEATS